MISQYLSVPISSLNIEDTSKSLTKDSAQAIEDILQGLYLHPMLKAKVVHVPVQTTKIYERVQIIDDIIQEQKLNDKANDSAIANLGKHAANLLSTVRYPYPLPILGGNP